MSERISLTIITGTAIAVLMAETATAAALGDIVTDRNGLVTNIIGLEVEGEGTFDVTFGLGSSFDDLFGTLDGSGPDPFFLGNPTGAEAATSSIVTSLGTTFAISADGFNADGSLAFTSDRFQVPFFIFEEENRDFLSTFYDEEFGLEEDSVDARTTGLFFDLPIATFSPSESAAVPEPEQVAGLLVAGLFVAGLKLKARAKGIEF